MYETLANDNLKYVVSFLNRMEINTIELVEAINRSEKHHPMRSNLND